MDNQIKLNVSSVSHAGRSYSGNEDNFYINGRYMYEYEMENIQVTTDCLALDHIFAVSDGFDRVATDKRPSLSMVKELKKFQDQLNVKYGDFESRLSILKDRLEETNNVFYSMSLNDSSSNSLIGEKETAFGSLFISDGKAATLNIGKTKVYLFRDGHLRPLTGDLKKSDRLLKMGIITNDQANILTGKFGIPIEDSKIGIQKSEVLEVKPGDLFMICSDGLSNVLDEEKINEILSIDKETGLISNMLVKEAIKNGSKDNITVVVVKIESQVNLEKSKVSKEEYSTKRSSVRGTAKKDKGVLIIVISMLVILLGAVYVMGVSFNWFSKDQGPPEVDASHAITITEDSTVNIETNSPESSEDTSAGSEATPQPEVTNSNASDEDDISGPIKYTVVSGDSLQKISEKFYHNAQKYKTIMEANNIKNENSLQIGQELIIP